MSGRPTRAAVERWADEVEAVAVRIGRRFARSEPRRWAVGYTRRPLGEAERKDGWHLVERLGEPPRTASCVLVIGTARLVLSAAYIKTKNMWVSAGAHILNDGVLIIMNVMGSKLIQP